jgi:homoserine kinase
MGDVIRSLNSLAYIVSVFATGDYGKLTDAVTDFIHQPYRERLFPYVKEMIEAGRGAGAYAGWLSGSGSSTLCAVPPDAAREVGEAMSRVLRTHGIGYQLFQLKADNVGLTILDDPAPASK